MNKKLFLLTLPALMVLSGCSGINNAPKANLMAEDNVAHEEIFGEAVEAGDLGLKKQAPRRLASLATWDDGFVKVGYQINFNAGGEGDSDDTISIRFVAAIKNAGVTAFWHRGLAQPNDNEGAEVSPGVWKFKFSEYKENDEGMESTKIYSSLTDGTNTITAGNGEFAGYAGFAIYTVTGIPYETYKHSYFAAYVILAEDGNPSNYVKSKAQAIKIEKEGTSSKNRFFFNPEVDGHFLTGTIEGNLRNGSDDSEHSLLRPVEYTQEQNAQNTAIYHDLDLKTTDSFGSFYYKQGSNFQFFGYNSFVKDTAGIYFEGSALGEFNKPVFEGIISVYVSRTSLNKIYGSTNKEVTIHFAITKDAGSGNGVFLLGEFNSWTISTACRLSWTDGNVWVGDFTLRIGSEYKAVVGPWEGTSVSYYENDPNHTATSVTSVSYNFQ